MKISDYQNILIVRTDRIGDVVLTTPAIKALREAYPSSRISILVAPATRELVEGNMCLDEILIDDRLGKNKGLRGFWELIKILRDKKFDCAFVFHTKKRTNLFCFLAGIPVRIGYRNNKFGFLLTQPIKDVRSTGEKHEAQYCLDVLKAVGIKSDDLTIELPVNENMISWAERFCADYHILPDDRLVAIHPGASDPAKQWPENRFAEVTDKLIKRYGAKIVIVGASHVRDIAARIVALSHHDLIDLSGKTTIGQLAGLFTQCSLLVSNDSGPVHVAAGVGTPVVSIFTRNQPGINPKRWRPLAERSRVVSVSPLQSEGISFKKAESKGRDYLELIPAKAVLDAVDALFKVC